MPTWLQAHPPAHSCRPGSLERLTTSQSAVPSAAIGTSRTHKSKSSSFLGRKLAKPCSASDALEDGAVVEQFSQGLPTGDSFVDSSCAPPIASPRLVTHESNFPQPNSPPFLADLPTVPPRDSLGANRAAGPRSASSGMAITCRRRISQTRTSSSPCLSTSTSTSTSISASDPASPTDSPTSAALPKVPRASPRAWLTSGTSSPLSSSQASTRPREPSPNPDPNYDSNSSNFANVLPPPFSSRLSPFPSSASSSLSSSPSSSSSSCCRRRSAEGPNRSDFVPRLQAISTTSAFLGGLCAVVDACTKDLPTWRRLQLELLAVAFITVSILLEASALYWCGSTRNLKNFEGSPPAQLQQPANLQRKGPTKSWLRLLLPTAALCAMGGFTALGSNGVKRFGIMPRTWNGLPGVLLASFVHFSWTHFGWNMLALILLGPCVYLAASTTQPQDKDSCSTPRDSATEEDAAVIRLAAASAFISLTSSFCVWCLARNALHAGASGVVWGYVGLLVALTLRRGDVPLSSLLLVVFVAGCYAAAAGLATDSIWSRHSISLYEACTSTSFSAEHHTFGFLSGLASVLFFCRPSAKQQKPASLEAEQADKNDSDND